VTALPTISIVVPNFNGARTLAATLQSLVDQNYPGLEIIGGGGSTDGSVEIIRKWLILDSRVMEFEAEFSVR
jgi:glycosyltransferase involved in cell wall biosynthesis